MVVEFVQGKLWIGKVCSQCSTGTACNLQLLRQYRAEELTADLQRVLFKWQDGTDQLSAKLRVLKDVSHLKLIIDCLGTGLEDFHWVPDVAD